MHYTLTNHEIIRLYEIESTNDLANTLLSKSEPAEGTAIMADFQRKGKGQIGRYWSADRGQNLLCSLIFYPRFITPADQFILNQWVSVSVADVLIDLGVDNVAVKWPNDVYVGDKKIGGILISNQLTGKSIKSCIVGLGLNVNQREWTSDIPNPTSLASYFNKQFAIMEIFDLTLSSIQQWYQTLIFGGKDRLEERYHNMLYRLNLEHTFIIDDREMLGIIKGVDNVGRLIIEINSIPQKFDFREVRFKI